MALITAMLVGCDRSDSRDRPAAKVEPPVAASAAATHSTPAQDDGHRAGLKFRGVPQRPIGYLGEIEFTTDSARFAVFQVGIDHRDELWLTQGARDDTVPEWTVVASFIPADTLNDTVRILLGCGAGGKTDSTLAVVLLYEDLPVLKRILHAWRADPVKRRFFPVETTGIECPNPSR